MKAKDVCHPFRIHKTKNGYELKMKFSDEQYIWLAGAANLVTEDCVCDLVGNCFWNAFEELSKEIKKKLEEQNQGPSDDTPRH